MFSRTKAPGNGTVTLIGPGVRIDGNIAFTGYLRVQGDIVGNVRCDSDSSGTAVVHGAGSVTGSISTPNIVIGGRVQGPLHASGSIAIQDGAHVTGDAQYKLLTIEPGAIVEGSMRSTAALEEATPRLDRRIVASDVSEIQALDKPVAHDRRASDRYRGKARVAGIAAAAIAVAGIGAWMSRDVRLAPPTDAVAAAVPHVDKSPPPAPSKSSTPTPPAPPQPPMPKVQPAAPPAIVEAPPPPEPPKPEKAKAENPKPVAGKIITVEGMDSEKPANVLFVKTRESAVLFVKSRNAESDGTRMEVPNRATRRYPISENDVIRVAQGRDVDIYFQGRKLSPSMIEGGQWIAFAPMARVAPISPVSPVTPASRIEPTTPAVSNAATGE